MSIVNCSTVIHYIQEYIYVNKKESFFEATHFVKHYTQFFKLYLCNRMVKIFDITHSYFFDLAEFFVINTNFLLSILDFNCCSEIRHF